MLVMTYRVLKEYLGYPSVIRNKIIVLKELEFPAVTVCPLTRVPKMFATEAQVQYMEEMAQLLDSLPVYEISAEVKTRCLKNPLCNWSWFDDECSCESNPCETLHCYPDINPNDDFCACSMLMCDWDPTSDACFKYETSTNRSVCKCKDFDSYPVSKQPHHPQYDKHHKTCDGEREECNPFVLEDLPEDFRNALVALNTSYKIADLLKKLKLAETDDAKDVERFFIPPLSVVDNYGMPFDNFILSCSYGPESCEHDFETLYIPNYGKCYIFNYVGSDGDMNKTIRKAKQPGREHGLQLYMQARKEDSLPLLTRELGVRVIVHDPRTFPTIAEESVDILPREMTSIGVEYKEVHRLGLPWGKCVQDGEVLSNGFSSNPYSQTECERQCVNMEVFKRCECYHPRFLPATLAPKNERICETNTTSKQDRCFVSVVEENDEGDIKCECQPACREQQYGVVSSASELNPDFFRILKKAKSLTSKKGKPTVSAITEELNADLKHGNKFSLMGVQIFYNSFFVTHMNETAIYSWESLVANIGGNMGLFLGLSIVTILEVIEFFTDIITNLIKGEQIASRRKTFVFTF